MGKPTNRIPGSRLLISSLPGWALRTQYVMLNCSASLAMSTWVLKALPGKRYIKRHSPSILYLWFGCSKEPSHQDDSLEYRGPFPQHIYGLRT